MNKVIEPPKAVDEGENDSENLMSLLEREITALEAEMKNLSLNRLV